jgi:hypothetical protein
MVKITHLILTLPTWKYALFCASYQPFSIFETSVEFDVVFGSLIADTLNRIDKLTPLDLAAARADADETPPPKPPLPKGRVGLTRLLR